MWQHRSHSKLFQNLLASELRESAARLSRDNRYRAKEFGQLLPALAQNLRLALENGTFSPEAPKTGC